MYKRIGCFLGILSAFGGVALCADVSSLTYQSNVGVNFTFNSTLSLTLDTADIYIESLAPGTVSDSNIITVNVTTNNKLGYTLTSTVGNATYNNRNLNLSGSNNNFASVNYGANVASSANLADNTWGYSYSVNNGTNWVAGSAGATAAGYSGLPLYTDTTNITTLRTRLGPTGVNGDDTKFKIAARASSAQAAGDYKNVINFNVVAEPEPMTLAAALAAAGKGMFNGYYVMQDMTPQICANAEEVDEMSALQMIDIRDNKIYWVTKLRDGHCWMTQNLDLDLNVDTTYTHANTDLGWGSDTATMSWKPNRSTIAWNGSAFSGWANNNTAQYSADPGDYYYAGYSGTGAVLPSTTVNYLTATPNANGDIVNNGQVYFSTHPSRVHGGTHEHVGNYYNWSAAVAMNDTSGYTSSTYGDVSLNPQNSICPAGWRLPTITNAAPNYANDGSKNETARLAYIYNGNVLVSGSSANLEAAPLYFVRGGRVYSSALVASAEIANYWSSTINSDSIAYYFHFNAEGVHSAGNNGYRSNGRSVRCLAR